MHLTDTSINHKQHKWSITISPSQLARLTIHWWKAHKSCTPLTSGTPFSFEDFTDSMKTVQALCPGRSLYAVPAPWLSPVQLCLLAALHSPEFAGKGLYVGAHVCMYVAVLTNKRPTNRLEQSSSGGEIRTQWPSAGFREKITSLLVPSISLLLYVFSLIYLKHLLLHPSPCWDKKKSVISFSQRDHFGYIKFDISNIITGSLWSYMVIFIGYVISVGLVRLVPQRLTKLPLNYLWSSTTSHIIPP